MRAMRTGLRLVAFAVAAVLCVAFALGLAAWLPSQGSYVDASRDYGYAYSGAKSCSTDFVAEAMDDQTMILFGSSELSTPPSLVPEVPANIFGTRNCGVSLMYIGEAYDQSLWHAIAAGAFADRVGNKKVAIVASPTWFVDGGLENNMFTARFSYALYRQFMENGSLSEETRERVRERVIEQGVDRNMADAGMRANPLAVVNDALFSFADDLKLRRDLADVARMGFSVQKVDAVPNFDALRERALGDAAERTSSNDWGIDDDTWNSGIGEHLDQIAGYMAQETYTETPEYEDFDLFLQVCGEAGLEPIVIVSPVHGDYYDWVGVPAATRGACYERIRAIAEEHGVAVADFSDREYERYFLHDQVHFGWTGWVDVSRALYDYAIGGGNGA